MIARLSPALTFLWNGPQEMTPRLRLEWRFVLVRWLGILFVAPALPLAKLEPDRLLAAYAVLALAAVYNLTIQELLRRGQGLNSIAYITTVGDSLLNLAIIVVGGGFSSPFSYYPFTVVVATGMRFGLLPAFATACMFVGSNIVAVLLGYDQADAAFFFRASFLVLVGLLAAYLREQAHRAEMALQERLRQANRLNEATAMLEASLDFERVLQAVTAAAAHLFEAPWAVLEPSDEFAGDVPNLIVHPADRRAPAGLQGLGRELVADGTGSVPTLVSAALPSGETVGAFPLLLPARQTTLGTLFVPVDGQAARLDADVLDSFIERTTLAVENAALYRTLASRSSDLQRAFADLAQAHQELLSVDEMKTNFLANVSHELRTPLSSIRAFSELLLSYDSEQEVQKEFVEIINTESERLTRLVNDVLDISKIEAGQMDWNMTRLDLAELLHDTARTYGTLIAQQENLSFVQEIEEDLPPIHGDRDRLQQVVGNLLNNAVKFTNAGFIRLAARRDGDEVRISVSDSGIGIPEEEQERIFEKFQQVGALMTNKPHGTGLGLSICRDIVRHHGGRIWVDSSPDQGSTFSFTLPLLAEVAQGAAVDAPVAERAAS